MRNKKKVKIVCLIVLVVVVMGLAVGAWYFAKTVDAKFEQDRTRILELKAELIEERTAHKKTKRDLEDVTNNLAFTQEELMQMTKKFDEARLEETVSEEVSTPEPTPAPTEVPVSAPSSTPEETPIYTEFDDGKCYMDICGSFIEPGSSRVQIDVMFHDTGAPDDYVVNIDASSGAAYNSYYTLTGNWNASTSSLDYHGDRVDTIDGVRTIYEGITGSLRFDDPDTLYWTDPGTENYDRGPFTKQ